jgi:hypothetical protein
MTSQEIKIYCPHKNNKRLDYIASQVITGFGGINISITSEKTDFLSYSGPAINYSKEKLNHGLHIFPQGLLEETGIRPQNILTIGKWEDFSCFFLQEEGDIPFDLFAASFYLLSRYEEYISIRLDEHKRFDPEDSLAYKNNFLDIPLVDRWAELLKKELLKKYPDIRFFPRKFRFISTFDIDSPYKYRYKSTIRSLGGFAKDIIQFNFQKIKERIEVLSHFKRDPYMDAIRWIEQWHKAVDKDFYLFILGEVHGKYGRHTDLPLTAYYQFLRELKLVTLGLHPSYETYENLELLVREKRNMEENLSRKIFVSRNHFLRIRLPETFEELSLVGIDEDFSLAYAKINGFRAGTALPHFFYSLDQDNVTCLLLHPTIMMDTTFIVHEKILPEEALKKIKILVDACYQSGGDYLSLWHNSNLSGKQEDNPWISVFIESFKYASDLEKNP